MYYKSKLVTLDNYLSIFEGYFKDVLDVIRSAILDNTEGFEKYIDMYADNPFMLWQVKLALEEGLDKYYIDNCFCYENLYDFRYIALSGGDLSVFKNAISCRVSREYMVYLIRWYRKGLDISNLKVNVIPLEHLAIYDRYYALGVDFRCVCVPSMSKVTEGYLSSVLKLLHSGVDVSGYLDGRYDENALYLLAKSSIFKSSL